MVKKLTVECRQCHQVSDLHLTTDARIVIFNCPSCWSTVMYHNGSMYVLNHDQVERIVNAPDQGAMASVLESIAGKNLDVPGVGSTESGPARTVISATQIKPSMLCHSGEQIITPDDVLNLRIELETRPDVAEFLAHL